MNMYYFFFRTGCCDCVNISNLNPIAFCGNIYCNFVPANCCCHTFYNPNFYNNNPFAFDNSFINFNNFEGSPFNF